MGKGTVAVWWICQRCGGEWRATVREHAGGRGCPSCGTPCIDRIVRGVAERLRASTPVGGPEDLPASLRVWYPEGPDLVLPHHKLGIDILDAPQDLDGSRRRLASQADRSYFSAVGWRLVTFHATSADGADPDHHEPVIFSLDDASAAIADISRYLSEHWSDHADDPDRPARRAAPGP